MWGKGWKVFCICKNLFASPAAYRLLGHPRVLGAAVVERGVGGRVQRLVLLLLGHLLQRQEAVLAHLDALRHVAHAGVFCEEKNIAGIIMEWNEVEFRVERGTQEHSKNPDVMGAIFCENLLASPESLYWFRCSKC